MLALSKDPFKTHLYIELRLHKSLYEMDVAISARARKSPYSCALSYLSTEPFPCPHKTHQASSSANLSPLFLVTSSVECPPLSELQCLTTQAPPPLPLPSLALLLQAAPCWLYFLWKSSQFHDPMLWITLYGSTSHTRLLIVLVSFPVAAIKYPQAGT